MHHIWQQNQRQRWGIRFLKPHQIKWIVSDDTLRQQISLSLKDRSAHFLRRYPDAHMNPTLYRQIYYKHKIKKKRLRWYKERPNQDEAVVQQQLAKMKRELQKAKKDKYRIIYLDETCFTRKTVANSEWALPGNNVAINTKILDEPTLALLSGISLEKGQEHFKIFPKSVDVKKFKEYLEELRALNGTDKVCLFLDNLSSHTSKKSKSKMNELGFRYIFNLPYSPWYNPIEFTFAKVKRTFRALRAKKMTGIIQDSHESLIVKAVRAINKKDVVNCVKHV